MQKYGPEAPLRRFRREAIHREAMARALADDDARYLPIAEDSARTSAAIDAKAHEIQGAEDLLIRRRAVERARKLRTASAYDQARRDLAAEALRLVSVLLPTPPSALKKAGVARARELVRQAIENMRRPEMPAEVRDEHLPVLEAELARMEAADRAEDDAAAAFASLWAALVLFKAERERERVSQYAALLAILGERPAAEEFFISIRARSPAAPAADAEAEADSGEPTE